MTNSQTKESKTNYRKVAKSLGVKYLFGRWGLSFGSKLSGKHGIRFIPLDGWITDPKEICKIMKERNMELKKGLNK